MAKDTVILTVFDRPEVALINALSQLGKNDLHETEILILDDGSRVDYSDVWASLDMLPLRVVRLEPGDYPEGTLAFDGHNNPAFANNFALAHLPADCERVFWLSSDTMLPADALARAREAVDAGAIYAMKVLNLDDGQEYLGPSRMFPMMWFVGCRREDVRAIGGFDEEYVRGMAFEDCDFMGRLFLRTGRLTIDAARTAVHQSHPAVYTSDGGEGYARSEAYTRDKWGGHVPFGGTVDKPFGFYRSSVGNTVMLTLDPATLKNLPANMRALADRRPVLVAPGDVLLDKTAILAEMALGDE